MQMLPCPLGQTGFVSMTMNGLFVFNKIPAVQECDATAADSSNAAKYKIINFILKNYLISVKIG